MGNEAQAKQATTEQCQGPRFRNRVATKLHTPLTSRSELQGKHQIIEVVIGPWPRQVFPTEIAAADKRTARAHGRRHRRAKSEIGKSAGAGEVKLAVPIRRRIAGPGVASAIVAQAQLINLAGHDDLLDHVTHGSDIVCKQSIAVKGEDHLVGIVGRIPLKGEGQRAIGWGREEGPCCGVVAWITAGDAPPHPSSSSGDADGNRASRLRHAIQDVDGDTNFCASAFVRVEAQPIADYLLISTDRGLDTTSRRIA